MGLLFCRITSTVLWGDTTLAEKHNLYHHLAPAENVKEIIDMNNKGKMPEQLEDYAFIKEQRNTEYGEEGQNVDLSKLE